MRKLNRLADRVLDKFVGRATASAGQVCYWTSAACTGGAMRRCCRTNGGPLSCSPCATPVTGPE